MRSFVGVTYPVQALGRWLMECVLRSPRLQGLRDGDRPTRDVPTGGNRGSELLNQTVLSSVPDQVRPGRETHLLEDSGPVGAHGLGTQAELDGRVLDCNTAA